MKTINTFLELSLLASLAAATQLLPNFTRGVYLPLAEYQVTINPSGSNLISSYDTWAPIVSSSWLNSFNVVIFTYINSSMLIPPAFESLRTSGQIKAGTKIIYSIGGFNASNDPNANWQAVFGTSSLAQALATTVS